jgi:hypothetical protein
MIEENVSPEGSQESVPQQPSGGFDFLSNVTLTEKPSENGEAVKQHNVDPPVTGQEESAEPKQENSQGVDDPKASPNTEKVVEAPTFEIDDNQLGSILSDATQGLIKDVNHLFQITEENARLTEELNALRQNPSALLTDPQQKKIYEFLSSYKGSDYETGLQSYARLQSIDIENMSPEAALKEDYIMEQSKYGIPKAEAELMFETEFEEKYASKGDLAKNFILKDAYGAKQRLREAKSEFTTPKVDAQEVEKNQMIERVRDEYIKSVDNSIRDYKSISLIGLTDNPENDFTFEVEDIKPVSEAMNDYQSFFNSRYLVDGKIDTEKLKLDTTRLIYQEKFDKMLFDHGTTIGREMEIARRNNIPNSKDKPASNLMGRGAVPNTFADALMGAKFKMS